MPPFGEFPFEATVVSTELVQEICEGVSELYHTLGWDGYLGSRPSSHHGLGYLCTLLKAKIELVDLLGLTKPISHMQGTHKVAHLDSFPT